MKSLKTSKKLAIALCSLIIIPNSVIMIMHDTGNSSQAHFLLLGYTVCLLILLFPLSSIISHFIIGKELTNINNSLNKAKKGDYSGHFPLPLQNENEDKVIKLKRNINWLIHAVSQREEHLNSCLIKEKHSKKRFQKKSYIDSLTKVYNRRYFDENITEYILSSSHQEVNIALIMIDCDHFKAVNDNHGHQAGDSVLKNLGSVLTQTIRNGQDYPFRYGGDEFGVVIMNTPDNRLEDIAEDIRINFQKNNQYQTTLSIGIAICRSDNAESLSAEQFKHLADQALYESKENGKDRVTIREWCN